MDETQREQARQRHLAAMAEARREIAAELPLRDDTSAPLPAGSQEPVPRVPDCPSGEVARVADDAGFGTLPHAPPPPTLRLARDVKWTTDWKLRQGWLKRAHELEAAGKYSDADIHLLNTFLVGDCECFNPQYKGRFGSKEEVKLRYQEMFQAALDPEKMDCVKRVAGLDIWSRMTHEFDRADLSSEREATLLLCPQPIRHAVTHVVTNRGRVLSRSRKGGEFGKVGNGGGEHDKSLSHLHFSARHGVYDEFGIGFNNPAVLDISPPILTIEAPHASEWKKGEPYTVVWVQYMLIDLSLIHI